ncbi:DUF2158 domain-containing protein [Chelatococcus sp. SYSU_G07232]|uniref:DUF2158 domain-containing protein n=1 Tax=Chelatococcus albus TaxID=3047466 RepID=A0ABT7AIX7_9HYPH|nr:DUF2158 domain-containing protein [Chelatococcus sp. SYSU_G07232]MDJ1159323.1 DUF2158 domain-containing protein [Chelatococcus sp. SYSU_G07232]
MSFEIGDVVMLKSGGPTLTVAEIAIGGVSCVWYAEDEDNFRTAVLPAACLIGVAQDDLDDEDHEAEKKEEEEDEELRRVG